MYPTVIRRQLFPPLRPLSPEPFLLAPQVVYSLVSLINHMGPSQNCGHYTAMAKAANGQVYLFDDASVSTRIGGGWRIWGSETG